MFTREYSFDQKISSAMTAVYAWMCCALAVTAAAAYYVATNHDLFVYVQQPGIMIALFLGQLAFVVGLSFFLNRISYATALALFLLYSFSLGITLSSIFYVYTHASIVSTFLTTAFTFGAMSLYGYATRSDLTTMGNMGFMVLIGLMIGMMVNMFLQSAQFDYVLSFVGVILFVLLTAYDTQKIKQLMQRLVNNEDMLGKAAVFGALTLYLDFINLFLFLLRFMGKRDER
jgi:FtsH-binding integral membrane protein